MTNENIPAHLTPIRKRPTPKGYPPSEHIEKKPRIHDLNTAAKSEHFLDLKIPLDHMRYCISKRSDLPYPSVLSVEDRADLFTLNRYFFAKSDKEAASRYHKELKLSKIDAISSPYNLYHQYGKAAWERRRISTNT